MNSLSRFARMALVAAVAFALPATAGATVKKDGAWPSADKKVDLEFDGKPSEGLQKLASEAGWSLVVSKAIAVDEHDVHIDVEDQPADAVLEALFTESNVVATRNGTLITVTPAPSGSTAAPPPTAPQAAPPTPPTPPIPPAPPAPSVRGEDKNVVGGSLVIHKDEIVHTVTVTGGSAKVEGTVTGDLVVLGGSAKVQSGARVIGNATVMGGSLKIEDGARVDGDVAVMGGSVKREEGAIIGGKLVDREHKGRVKVSLDDGNVSTSVKTDDGDDRRSQPRSRIADAAHSFGRKVTAMSLLFVFGCVLLALATGRMERLRIEAAARPMRSFALGLVGSIAGGIAAIIAIVVLCITVVGIPLAVLGTLLAVFAVYGAIAAVLTTFGAAVLGHKTQNVYVHLLFGCGAFLLASSLPWIGGLVTFAVTMIAIGSLFSTRLAGFLEKKKPATTMGLV